MLKMKLSVLHVAAGLWKKTGGPSEVIPNLCRSLSERDVEVTLCSIDGDNANQVTELKNTSVSVHLFRSRGPFIRYAPSMRDFLKDKRFDVIHNHGQWLWPNWLAASQARFTDCKFVTTPHGTLVPGMLSRSVLKKKLAWKFFDKRLINRSDMIHALSDAELRGMSAALSENRSKAFVIPNGVDIPSAGDRMFSNKEGEKVILFLSRVSEIKGIKPLIYAWKNLAKEFPGWRLRIVGPIDSDIKPILEKTKTSVPRIEIVGGVYDQDRWDEYRKADLFILPTFGEGLPTVLLEAAAHQLPIITTREANFMELNDAGGSIHCKPNLDSVESALGSFLKMCPGQQRDVGLNAFNLVKNNYTWGQIADKWKQVYERLKNAVPLEQL